MAKQTPAKQRLAGYLVDQPDRATGERWVTMSNALTRAGHGLTLSEKRVIASAVSQLDSRAPSRPGDVLVTKIIAAEYAATFGVNLDTAYNQLQAAAKNLYSRSITFFEAAERRNGQPLPPTRVQMRWVGRVKYHEGEGWVELAWWNELLPHLTGLHKQFTTYQLQQASALRSVYSWKLIELLTRFRSSGEAEYTIEDFRESMEAPASLSDFGQVKRRIIDPAVKELTEKDGWEIAWRPIKAGRRVKAVHFSFRRAPQLSLPLSEPPTPRALDAPPPAPARRRGRPRRQPTARELADFAHPGETEADALARWHQRAG
jgi:plasmid replication initiation protein